VLVNAPHPGSAIALTTKFMPLAFFLFFVKPYVALNGHVIPTNWGRLVIPVAPGQYHLYVHTPYLLPTKLGPAEMPVMVGPGQVVEMEYRSPLTTFSKGSLGPPPQKYNGVGATIAIYAVCLALLICVCGALIVSANS